MVEIRDSAGLEPAQTVEALQAALERERARAREIDHRAKNSLQLVASLLLLHGRRCKEVETQQVLKAMHQRLGAVAAVHRDLLSAESADRFDLTRFIRDHVAALVQARGEGSTVRLELDRVEVQAAHACPLALIINELVLNALTHGGRPGGEIALRLAPAGNGFVLTVQDDGPGRAPDAETGFGLTMVRLLAQQVGASFALEAAEPGVRAVVTAA